MNKRLSDSEIKVLNILWEKGTMSAKDVCAVAEETIGWNKNTTYTVLTKMVAKGIIKRDEPGFLCTAMVSEKSARKGELESLLVGSEYEHGSISFGVPCSVAQKNPPSPKGSSLALGCTVCPDGYTDPFS